MKRLVSECLIWSVKVTATLKAARMSRVPGRLPPGPPASPEIFVGASPFLPIAI
jgi:hypothetical protein